MSRAPSSVPVPASERPPPRIVTAASLFDGHDAAINIMRRIMQARGAEVIHLGHDRSVEDIVTAAIQEDADAIAVSSYQGGHEEFFCYMVDELRRRGAGHILVYGGGGGTILPDEITALQRYGVKRIFSPEDGRSLGLRGMIETIFDDCAAAEHPPLASDLLDRLTARDPIAIASAISACESGDHELASSLRAKLPTTGARVPVIGLTGTGGAGKSSVVDEVLRRLQRDAPDAHIGLLLVDPTRRRSGGALLGDRIRINALGPHVFARSMATRSAHRALSPAVEGAIAVLQTASFDLILVETAGIGQSDSQIVDSVDLSVYVMTPEYGAPSQLEKIDMLELADVIVLNKFDRRGGSDALRDVRKQWKRNHLSFQAGDAETPVYPTVASQWDDPGMERAYTALRTLIAGTGTGVFATAPPDDAQVPVGRELTDRQAVIPPQRQRYLSEVTEHVRGYREQTRALVEHATDVESFERALRALGDEPRPSPSPYDPQELDRGEESERKLRRAYNRALEALGPELSQQLQSWPQTRARYRASGQSYRVRDKTIEVENHVETLAGSRLPRVALPQTERLGELVRYIRQEHLPGSFPFTAGVFPFKRKSEDAARMFAGEGPPERTNRRFHYLASGQPAVRLSTAFDSVTLYGRDPARRPDIYGKVGNSGVSVCTVDDAKKLYSGFDLCDPRTSVSMTINGPAPTVLAFFLNAAIDQQVERHLRAEGRLDEVRDRLGPDLPTYRGELPPGHDGFGLGLLGIPGDRAVDADTYARIRSDVLQRVRGTVQADILKEDQAQNTCIFSTAFALKMMGDIQQYFIDHGVRNFYSVSVSGYHIAEAGANPITQLALTLANAFTYVEYYRARGMRVDDFAPNFSFFFSNGLDAEYNVIGRVARRIWAIAMRDLYRGNERSQKLKYHVQTSGRSLHAQEMAFNDIRTTLQALSALADHCNSLHTNAYDEAVTTPTEESVRRALAIQLIIQRELGLLQNENPIQGSYAIELLTDLVEDAVLAEFDRLSERGGVLGAMESLYQRGKIQEESLHYESLKHSGQLPVVGVNTFEHPDASAASTRPAQVMRSARDERDAQLASLTAFHRRFGSESSAALGELEQAARRGDNVFDALMRATRVASLGQTTDALFAAGGSYRRAM